MIKIRKIKILKKRMKKRIVVVKDSSKINLIFIDDNIMNEKPKHLKEDFNIDNHIKVDHFSSPKRVKKLNLSKISELSGFENERALSGLNSKRENIDILGKDYDKY